VFVAYSGLCTWLPRYELSATQCNIDVTWFPFDKQTCNVSFMSWIMLKQNILLYPNYNVMDFVGDEPSDWAIEGAYNA